MRSDGAADTCSPTPVARPRFYTTLLAVFAGVALTLAVIGIRKALGTDTGAVVGMVVSRWWPSRCWSWRVRWWSATGRR